MWPQVDLFKIDQVAIFVMVYPYLKQHILFNSNGLAICHGIPVITHITVKSSCRSANFNLIKLTFFMVYPYMKRHILLV